MRAAGTPVASPATPTRRFGNTVLPARAQARVPSPSPAKLVVNRENRDRSIENRAPAPSPVLRDGLCATEKPTGSIQAHDGWAATVDVACPALLRTAQVRLDAPPHSASSLVSTPATAAGPRGGTESLAAFGSVNREEAILKNGGVATAAQAHLLTSPAAALMLGDSATPSQTPGGVGEESDTLCFSLSMSGVQTWAGTPTPKAGAEPARGIETSCIDACGLVTGPTAGSASPPPSAVGIPLEPRAAICHSDVAGPAEPPHADTAASLTSPQQQPVAHTPAAGTALPSGVLLAAPCLSRLAQAHSTSSGSSSTSTQSVAQPALLMRPPESTAHSSSTCAASSATVPASQPVPSPHAPRRKRSRLAERVHEVQREEEEERAAVAAALSGCTRELTAALRTHHSHSQPASGALTPGVEPRQPSATPAAAMRSRVPLAQPAGSSAAGRPVAAAAAAEGGGSLPASSLLHALRVQQAAWAAASRAHATSIVRQRPPQLSPQSPCSASPAACLSGAPSSVPSTATAAAVHHHGQPQPHQQGSLSEPPFPRGAVAGAREPAAEGWPLLPSSIETAAAAPPLTDPGADDTDALIALLPAERGRVPSSGAADSAARASDGLPAAGGLAGAAARGVHALARPHSEPFDDSDDDIAALIGALSDGPSLHAGVARLSSGSAYAGVGAGFEPPTTMTRGSCSPERPASLPPGRAPSPLAGWGGGECAAHTAGLSAAGAHLLNTLRCARGEDHRPSHGSSGQVSSRGVGHTSSHGLSHSSGRDSSSHSGGHYLGAAFDGPLWTDYAVCEQSSWAGPYAARVSGAPTGHAFGNGAAGRIAHPMQQRDRPHDTSGGGSSSSRSPHRPSGLLRTPAVGVPAWHREAAYAGTAAPAAQDTRPAEGRLRPACVTAVGSVAPPSQPFDLDRELGLPPQASCEPVRRPLSWDRPHERGAQWGGAAGAWAAEPGPEPEQGTRGCSPMYRGPEARGRQPFRVGGGGGGSASKSRGSQRPSASPACRQTGYYSQQHIRAVVSPLPAAASVPRASGARARSRSGAYPRSRSRPAAAMRQRQQAAAKPQNVSHGAGGVAGPWGQAVHRRVGTAGGGFSSRSPGHGPARRPLAAHSGGSRARVVSKAWR